MNARLTEIASIWKANQWLYGVGGFILGLLAYPFGYAIITTQLSSSNRVFPDLLQAIEDTNLEIVLTGTLVLGLFIAGWLLGQLSFTMQINAEREIRGIQQKTSAIRKSYWSNFWQGMSTELFGAVLTTVAFGIILLIFQQYQSIQNRKEELILQMGSTNNIFAIEAYRQIQSLGWHEDGTLIGADLEVTNLVSANLLGVNLASARLGKAILLSTNLWGANLEGADLREVNLIGANLSFSIITGAYLWDADLEGADLIRANLVGADLIRANLESTNLSRTNLASANLSRANLASANLLQANLVGADLSNAIFNESTVLPNDTLWTPETEITRYTDPNHPNFWQPDWARSGYDAYGEWLDAGSPHPDDTQDDTND